MSHKQKQLITKKKNYGVRSLIKENIQMETKQIVIHGLNVATQKHVETGLSPWHLTG